MARGDLTNDEWERIRKYLPISPIGRLPRNLRKQIDGVNWRYRTGSQWREVPERFGHWNTVYQLHRRYSQNGTWAAILLGVIREVEELGDIDWFVSVDSTTVRAHQDASGALVDQATLAKALAWIDAKINPPSQDEDPHLLPVPIKLMPQILERHSRRQRDGSAPAAARPGPAPPSSGGPEAD